MTGPERCLRSGGTRAAPPGPAEDEPGPAAAAALRPRRPPVALDGPKAKRRNPTSGGFRVHGRRAQPGQSWPPNRRRRAPATRPPWRRPRAASRHGTSRYERHDGHQTGHRERCLARVREPTLNRTVRPHRDEDDPLGRGELEHIRADRDDAAAPIGSHDDAPSGSTWPPPRRGAQPRVRRPSPLWSTANDCRQTTQLMTPKERGRLSPTLRASAAAGAGSGRPDARRSQLDVPAGRSREPRRERRQDRSAGLNASPSPRATRHSSWNATPLSLVECHPDILGRVADEGRRRGSGTTSPDTCRYVSTDSVQ